MGVKSYDFGASETLSFGFKGFEEMDFDREIQNTDKLLSSFYPPTHGKRDWMGCKFYKILMKSKPPKVIKRVIVAPLSKIL